MKALNTLWALPLLGMLTVPAMAGGRYAEHYGDTRFEQRIDRQHARIGHGVRNGELTRKEAKRLRKQHRHIARLEDRFARDGHLDRYERHTLRRELDAASERIYRLKHNDRYRVTDRPHRRHGGGPHNDSGWQVGLTFWDRL